MDFLRRKASFFLVAFSLAAFTLLFCPVTAHSQINTYLRAIHTGQAQEGAPLRVSAELAKSTELARVVLYYRQFGQSEFRVLEMQIAGDTASAIIPEGDVAPPFMEVYVLAQTPSGTTETLPFENPQSSPTRITITAKSPKDQEILILSPDKSDHLTPADLYISISFVYAKGIVDQKRTKVFFDKVNVSALAVSVGDLTIVSPDALPRNLSRGVHTLDVEVYDTTGALYHSLERTFSVISEGEAESEKEKVLYSGNAQAEARNEDIKGAVTPYRRLTANANASYGIIRTTGNIFLTSEEESTRQPQDRYFLGIDAKYAKLGLGDVYPVFPTTIMDGRRLRGVTADLLLGAFNVDYASGQVLRRVDMDTSAGVSSTTLERSLTAVRPSFGKGENFQLGFTYLHSKDGFSNTDTVVKPQENVVVGSDMIVAFDNHHFELTGQTSYSLNNVDISAPPFTDASIDTSKLTSSTKNLLKKFGTNYLAKVITLNGNLQPLPPGLTALVYETGLAMDYFGNYLKGTYLYHGADYISVGTTALRRDVKGFNVFDRVRLMENSVFLTGSFERLQDNTSGRDTILTSSGKVELTTTYTNFNSSVSYYPTSNMPNFTVGYGRNGELNPINPHDSIANVAAQAIDDNTNRYFVQSTYDFSYWGRHNATLSLDISNKTDNTPKKQDVKGINAFLLVNTVHRFPLETSVGYSMSLNTIPKVTVDTVGGVAKIVTSSMSLNYTTITLNGRYKFYKDMFRISGTVAPTFGDFKRTVLETSLQYSITDHQSAAFQYQWIINSGVQNDSYVSLIYRVNL